MDYGGPVLVFTTDGAALSSSNQYNSNSGRGGPKRADLFVSPLCSDANSMVVAEPHSGPGAGTRHRDAAGSQEHRRATQGGAFGELTWLRLDRYDHVFCGRKERRNDDSG